MKLKLMLSISAIVSAVAAIEFALQPGVMAWGPAVLFGSVAVALVRASKLAAWSGSEFVTRANQ